MSAGSILNLWDNHFSGSISSALGNLCQLELLSLRDNCLAGPIPTEVGYLTQLLHLRLLNNSLTGPIPSVLYQLNSLTLLWLNGMNFFGSMSNLHLMDDLSVNLHKVDCSCCE